MRKRGCVESARAIEMRWPLPARELVRILRAVDGGEPDLRQQHGDASRDLGAGHSGDCARIGSAITSCTRHRGFKLAYGS
jgi:hypothetical protein